MIRKLLFLFLVLTGVTGRVNAQLAPVGKYVLSFTPSINSPNDSRAGDCDSRMKVTLQTGSGYYQDKWDISIDDEAIGHGLPYLPVGTYQYEYNADQPGDETLYLKFWANVRDHRRNTCFQRIADEYYFYPPAAATVPYYAATFTGYAGKDAVPCYNSSMTVTRIPKDVTIYYSASQGFILPYDNTLTFEATRGFPPGIYGWECRTSSTSWQDMPAAVLSADKHLLEFRGPDLPNDLFNYAMSKKENIFIRIKYGNSTTTVNSNTITLTPRFTAPHIIQPVPLQPACFNEKGGVKLFFDRALRPKESLVIYLEDPTKTDPNEKTIWMETITALAADNSYTSPVVLTAREYDVSLTGIFPNDLVPVGVTYTDDPSHKSNFKILNPDELIFSAVKNLDVSCFGGSDGQLTVTANGGTGTLQLQLKEPVIPLQTNFTIFRNQPLLVDQLKTGHYQLYLTDANGCKPKNADGSEKILPLTVDQPAAALQITGTTLEHPSAYTYSDGSITIYVKGGTAAADGSYQAIWKKADGTVLNKATGKYENGVYAITLPNLPDGTYSVAVTDASFNKATTANNAGCTTTATFTLTQPPVLSVTASIKDSIGCNGEQNGTLYAVATGGKPAAGVRPYTYEWYRIAAGVRTPLQVMGTEAALLPAGQYLVTVTDGNHITRESAVLTLIDPPVLAAILQKREVSCFGGADGILTVVPSGGTGSYRYTWNTGAATATINALSAATYNVQVKDVHNCLVRVAETVSQPAVSLHIAAPEIVYPSAFGYADGHVKIVALGGTAFKNGHYQVTWKNAAGTVLTTHTEQVTPAGYESLLSGQPAGKYTLTITDSLYNQAALSSDMMACYYTYTFTLIAPPLLTVAIQEQHYVSCKEDADGVLTASAQGGVPLDSTPAYRFDWFRIINGVPVAIGQRGVTASALTAAIYRVRVTDFNNIERWSADYVLTEPDYLLSPMSARAVSCFGGNDGFVKTVTTGGVLPYTYVWSNGAATPAIQDIAAGSYHMKVMDAHGCIVQQDTTVVQPASALAITASILKNPLAFSYQDGSITIDIAGGTPDANGAYEVKWLDATGQELTNVTNSRTANGYRSVLHQAGAGSYTIQVKDHQFVRSTNGSTSGCYITGTYILREPVLLEVNIQEQQVVSCNGRNDGQLVAHAKGGMPATTGLPYQYSWVSIVNGQEVSIPQTDSIITRLYAGVYRVAVTDENNIIRYSPLFTLQQPAILQVQIATTPVTCASGMDGTATALVRGGTSPYHYEWTTGENSPAISNVTEGSYFVFVKDSRNCETQGSADIYIPDGIKIAANISHPICYNDRNGSIQVTLSGAVPPYTSSWEDGSTGTNRAGLAAGKYTLTIRDANNCIRIQHFILEDPIPLVVNAGADIVLCNGQSWTANAAIADPAAIYRWTADNGFTASASLVTLKNEGTYFVDVTDSKGCKGRATVNVKVNKVDIDAEFLSATEVLRNDEVMVVNISHPVPDRVVWKVPSNSGIIVLQETPVMANLRFTLPGTWQISLHAYVGNCEQVFTKTITVLEAERLPVPGGAEEPFIKKFELMPNPSNGKFSVKISLDKAAPVRLRLLNVYSNQLVSDRKEAAATDFNLSYQLQVTAGTYVMVLETPLGKMIRKIIIN